MHTHYPSGRPNGPRNYFADTGTALLAQNRVGPGTRHDTNLLKITCHCVDAVKRSKVSTFVLVKLFLLLPHAGAIEENPFRTMTYHLIEVKLLS